MNVLYVQKYNLELYKRLYKIVKKLLHKHKKVRLPRRSKKIMYNYKKEKSQHTSTAPTVITFL